jgi:putative ABC transport system permease protein
MHALINDHKCGRAVLRRERGLTAAAVLALALGIGATTAVFSVGNILKDGADKPAVPEIYTITRADMPLGYEVDLVVRTGADPARTTGTVRQVVRALDPAAVVGTTRPLAERLRASFDQPRFSTAVIATFASVALVLSSLGLFGVPSYTVTQRQRELSVRAALGAGRRDRFALVLREGLTVTAGGLLGGMLAAAALAQLARGVLFGIAPIDPVAYLAAPLLLLPIATAACVIPARRATQVAPAAILRGD